MTIERIDPIDGASLYMSKLLRTTQRYLWALSHCQGTVVDIACGLGFGTMLLATQPKVKTLIGVDVSKETIAACLERYAFASPRVEFLCAEAMKIPNADVIVCFETIEHMKDPPAFLARVKKMKPKALLLSIPHGEKMGHNPHHLYCWNKKEFQSLLKRAGFSIRDAWIQKSLHPTSVLPQNFVLRAEVI